MLKAEKRLKGETRQKLLDRVAKVRKNLPKNYRIFIGEALPEFNTLTGYTRITNVQKLVAADDEITEMMEAIEKKYAEFKKELFAELKEISKTYRRSVDV